MSSDAEVQRSGADHQKSNNDAIQISKPVDVMAKGLPSNPDVERLVLGSVLLDDNLYPRVAGALEPSDFSLEKHRRIFARMHDLYERGSHIDRITLADELMKRGQLESVDGLTYLISLDDGLPELVNLEAYIAIIKEKATLRAIIFNAQSAINQALLGTIPSAELIGAQLTQFEQLRQIWQPGQQIRCIEDLESIFGDRTPTKYLIEPEVPERALVILVGTSEAGKTTLACAWARDLLVRGHSVLIIDRDKNPRERIRDRMARLGINIDSGPLYVWDSEQSEQPPQPDDPRIVEWVKRRYEEDEKSPLIIADSLIGFFDGDEDENNSQDMRRHLNRSRVLNYAGATVVELHHANREGKPRGSSDLEPAIDQAFFVSNRDRSGGRLLDVITLKYVKSRYGHSGSLMYFYQRGTMVRDERPQVHERIESEKLTSILRTNPGITATKFEALAAAKDGITREVARRFLGNGCLPGGGIRREPLPKGNGHRYYLEV
jgi:hypothetical protein